MGILQKADRCMDKAAALFGENKLFWQRIRHRRQPVFIRAVAHMSRWQRLSILWESYMHLLET